MARDKNPKNKGLWGMNLIVKKLLMALDDNYVSTLNLNEKNAEVKTLINDQLDLAKGVSNGSIIDFTRQNLRSSTTTPNAGYGENEGDLVKYIRSNSTAIYQTYSDRYKNKFIEGKDLKFISKFIPSLGQCVRIMLTHIISSDDLSGSVKRGLDLGSNITDDENVLVMKAIDKFEKDTNLLYKLKEQVYKGALTSGTYYVYAVSYKKLFQEYDKTRKKARKNGVDFNQISLSAQPSTESVEYRDFVNSDDSALYHTCALESAQTNEIKKFFAIDGSVFSKEKLTEEKVLGENVIKSIADVYTVESSIPVDVLESMPAMEAVMSDATLGKNLKEKLDASSKSGKNDPIADGVASINSRGEEYDISGTFLKFIDYKNIIKLEVLGEVIGYLYVESNKKAKNTESMRFVNGEITNIKKEDATEKIAKMLSSQIVKNFDSKFVKDNIQFKNLIANCIMANGVINTEYKIQFIPPEDMVEFPICVDANGDGVSMLADSLFPAKIACSFIMRKHLNYLNNSGDKNIAYIRGNTVDINKRNRTEQIIRNMQEANITFGDMMSDQSLMFQKFASNNNILMPVGRGGNKLIEFEKMDGQQIDMSTEYEKSLIDQAVIATGVPPLLIEQYNNADFAKAYTSAHIGFAGIVAGYQADLEVGSTKLYKKIIENLDIDDSLKARILPNVEFKLPRPKALAAVNSTETIQNAVSVAQQYTQLRFGDQPEDADKDKVKVIQEAIVRDQTPFIDWEHFDDIAKDTIAENDNIKNSNGGGQMDATPSDF